jgi:hypothetical protein
LRELPIWLNVLRALSLGLVYGYIEEIFIVSVPSDSPAGMYYRIAYTVLLVVPFINPNLYVWGADAVLATMVQDGTFWIIDYALNHNLPVSWAAYYPVVDHVPLLYFPAAPLIVYLYYQARKHKID